MYTAKINSSIKELSKRECVMYKDTTNCKQLDTIITDDSDIIIDIDNIIVLDVHNDKAKDNTDYKKYIIVDKSGEKYITGSESFYRAVTDIYEELDGEDVSVKCYKMESKNYPGKSFITASLF